MANLTIVGRATKIILDTECERTYIRAMEFFNNNPNELSAFWGKDEFLKGSATEEEKTAFVKKHPEIEDIHNHTSITRLGNMIILGTFCPRLYAGIKELYDNGYTRNNNYDICMDSDINPDDLIIKLYEFHSTAG